VGEGSPGASFYGLSVLRVLSGEVFASRRSEEGSVLTADAGGLEVDPGFGQVVAVEVATRGTRRHDLDPIRRWRSLSAIRAESSRSLNAHDAVAFLALQHTGQRPLVTVQCVVHSHELCRRRSELGSGSLVSSEHPDGGRYSPGYDQENRVLLRPVSVADERSALAPLPFLFHLARRLYQAYPDGPLPDGGVRPDILDVGSEERQQELTALLRDFIADPALSARDLHDRCTQLAFYDYDVRAALRELSPEPSPRLVDTARQLVSTGTDQRAVLVGLVLLTGHADQRDIPVVKMLGLLDFAALQAAYVLLAIPGAETDAMWVADRSPGVRGEVGDGLSGHPDPDVRYWVGRNSSMYMRHVRERAGKHELRVLLDQPHVDDALWDHVGKRLLEMSHRYVSSEIGYYQHDTTALRRWVALADQRPATVDRAVLLCSLAEELVSGYAALVVRDLRGGLVAQIRSVLNGWSDLLAHTAQSDDAGEARRAAWVLRQAAGLSVPQTRFAVRVVPHAPDPVGGVEARILIDGTPVYAAAFQGGISGPPERVINGGRLQATSEQREILLDDYDGTDLYVTIVREDAEVVWKDWRWTMRSDRLPGEFRFDADEYDREVSRAEADRSWEWPARTVARLVNDRLRADPTILGRWDCGPGHCRNARQVHDAAILDFSYPVDARWGDPSVTFRLGIDVGDRDPEVVADDVIAMLCASDPRETVEMVGADSEAGAEHLGLVHRPSTLKFY
jgi:hypothetical protein